MRAQWPDDSRLDRRDRGNVSFRWTDAALAARSSRIPTRRVPLDLMAGQLGQCLRLLSGCIPGARDDADGPSDAS